MTTLWPEGLNNVREGYLTPTSYAACVADRRRGARVFAAMHQPLDVAVLHVRSEWERGAVAPLEHLSSAVVQSAHFAAVQREALPAQLHETHATERGS